MDAHHHRKSSTQGRHHSFGLPSETQGGMSVLAIINNSFNGNFEEAAHFYYKEANKLYFANIVLNNQLKNITEEKIALATRLAHLEQEQGYHGLAQDKKKRHRRTAGEIQRSFNCPVENCQKAYGSEGSLSQHLKIKHPQQYLQYTALEEERHEREGDDGKDKERDMRRQRESESEEDKKEQQMDS